MQKNIDYHQADAGKGTKNNSEEKLNPESICLTVCITLRALWVIPGHLCVRACSCSLCVCKGSAGHRVPCVCVCVSITVSGGRGIT